MKNLYSRRRATIFAIVLLALVNVFALYHAFVSDSSNTELSAESDPMEATYVKNEMQDQNVSRSYMADTSATGIAR